MAGRGRAPKHASNRRNRAAPQRGEWIELQPVTEPVPPLPQPAPDGEWSRRTELAWEAWWSDPASTQWGVADKQLISDLAYIYEVWSRKPTGGREEEMRQRLDGLGLSPKGRQDRRWMLPIEDEREEGDADDAPLPEDVPDLEEFARRRAARAARKDASAR